MKNYNNIEMMKKPKTKQVKSKQIEEWISEGRAVLRNDLTPEHLKGWPDNYYLFDDVGLIIRDTIERKNGILYEEYSEYLIFSAKNRERAKRAEQSSISPDASFPGYIQVTVKEFETMIATSDKLLATEFSISPDVLDYSMPSLIYLDKAIKKVLRKFDYGDFDEKYAVLISAYCGEVMRRKIDGTWKITGNADGMLNQILVVEKNNPEYSYRPQMPIALILSGDAPKGSNLKIEVDAQLYKYGFIKGNEEHYGIK
ncbi:hypothetical protein DU508_06715 [Pedobacter chinensis]|uniref:Uncharacterized protein n=1 Tax=Pedobacter chinensis TaxID=2282421 RepID=A0A369Q1R9_9SPHI|nr:hypothetical protein [Pedobacter chinensis]RDC56889.1 hypothetical protein DU508_06715 [Pedobacter chinensis]